MIGSLIMRIVATALGRWILGGVVASLIAFAAWKWHAFKEDLIHQGQQVCVQEINKETVEALERALSEERAARAALAERAAAAATENAAARQRAIDLERGLQDLAAEMERQRQTDETYAAWSATTLPDGVAGRVLNAGAGGHQDPSGADGN